MNQPENLSENSLNTEVSTQTTRPPGSFLQRTLWTGCFMVIGSALAIHGALAYSPELARFVPERLIKSPVSASSCHASNVGACQSTGGCQSRAMMLASDEFGGCCSMRKLECPVMTDGLYEEAEPVDSFADAPADAADCVPANSENSESAAEITEPQASLSAPAATVAATNE